MGIAVGNFLFSLGTLIVFTPFPETEINGFDGAFSFKIDRLCICDINLTGALDPNVESMLTFIKPGVTVVRYEGERTTVSDRRMQNFIFLRAIIHPNVNPGNMTR